MIIRQLTDTLIEFISKNLNISSKLPQVRLAQVINNYLIVNYNETDSLGDLHLPSLLFDSYDQFRSADDIVRSRMRNEYFKARPELKGQLPVIDGIAKSPEEFADQALVIGDFLDLFGYLSDQSDELESEAVTVSIHLSAPNAMLQNYRAKFLIEVWQKGLEEKVRLSATDTGMIVLGDFYLEITRIKATETVVSIAIKNVKDSNSKVLIKIIGKGKVPKSRIRSEGNSLWEAMKAIDLVISEWKTL